MGIVLALFGLGIFNLHYWGFGVPFIMAGAWLLVRAYRLQQKLKLAGGESRRRATIPPPSRLPSAGGVLPRPNKRYTPPTEKRKRASRVQALGLGADRSGVAPVAGGRQDVARPTNDHEETSSRTSGRMNTCHDACSPARILDRGHEGRIARHHHGCNGRARLVEPGAREDLGVALLPSKVKEPVHE